MKKIASIMISFIIFAGMVCSNFEEIYAKGMPSNAVPVKVKIQNTELKYGSFTRHSKLYELDGFNVGGENYLKGRDLANVVAHFSFSWNPDTKNVEIVDETNNAKLYTNADLEKLGALQYNGENYFKVRTLLELALINPKISYNANTKVISYSEQDTVSQTMKNPKTKFSEIDKSNLSTESKKQMYKSMYEDLKSLFTVYNGDHGYNDYSYRELDKLGQTAFNKRFSYDLDEISKLMSTNKYVAGDRLFDLDTEFWDIDTPLPTEELERYRKMVNELEDYMPVALVGYDQLYPKDVVSGNLGPGGSEWEPYGYYMEADDNEVVSLNINGKFKRFVGRYDQYFNPKGTKVYGDGKLLYTFTEPDGSFDIDLTGVKNIRIEKPINQLIKLYDPMFKRY